ncbi:hypothetical protein Anas_00381 [Armadillidium nasatum]|uniref:Uncharacterized protein n=1 Tax=Armadillidium nasatum TaxID=96803 RepID=A0A5N5SLC8_9CRUS|nr:hypothetical protein Anas_00381 [Armadillidium nasatum]
MSKHKCIKVSSFGSLQHFRKEDKPKNGGKRCLDCKVEPTCAYSAKKIYLDPKPESAIFPMNAVCDIEDTGTSYYYHLKKEIETGPYGKCVYETDNNVCDNQVVNFEFDNGSTASLTMIAYSKDMCQRKTVLYGTKGQLQWDDFKDYSIQHYDFLTQNFQIIDCEEENPGWGHGGSDFFIIDSFVKAVATKDESYITTGPQASLNSHLLTFAAEHSRVSGQVVDLTEDSKLESVNVNVVLSI